MKNSSKIEMVLPFVLAILLPGLNFLNNSSEYQHLGIILMIPTWITVSTFLIFIWYVNDWLGRRIHRRFYLKIMALNLGFILIFVLFLFFILPADFEPSFSFYRSTTIKFFSTAAIFITIQQSLQSAKKIEHLKSENLLLKTEKYKTELDQLRKQVNPHFLFNSLSVLRTMVRGDHPKSEEFVINLSTLYRQILQNRDKDYVVLEEEVRFLQTYIYLLKVRHEDALDVQIDIDPKSYTFSLPVFSLQLLVENCVKHNILSVRDPLKIHIHQNEEKSITVSNNFQPKEESAHSTGVGLNNLLHRYQLLGIENGLQIEKNDESFNVTIKLF